MRKLVTLREVTEIHPIEGADLIELVKIDGWQCVAKRGEFKVGHVGVYFEIDSFLDHTRPEFAFLAPRAIKWEGKEGVRIKSMKLKGTLSQGLLLPMSAWPDSDAGEGLESAVCSMGAIDGYTLDEMNEQLDLAAALNVEKWEKRLAANLAGTARGNFPSFIFKTDQERVQNLPRVFSEYGDRLFQVTQKFDGSSMTVYVLTQESKYFDHEKFAEDGNVYQFGVCSRNLDLVDTEGNAFWQAFHREEMLDRMVDMLARTRRPALAVQGELIGKSIQNNHEKVEGDDEFHLYDVFDIDGQHYMNPFVARTLAETVGFNHVPVIHEAIRLNDYAKDRDELLLKVVGPSVRAKYGEGKVFKLLDDTDGFSFKGISNEFLVKCDG